MHLFAIFFFPIFGFGFLFYFLPSILAAVRGKRDLVSIFVLNFLLGWTAIGWVIALLWSVKADARLAVR
jgi:hypothetical protein